jgi:hypothetical protein
MCARRTAPELRLEWRAYFGCGGLHLPEARRRPPAGMVWRMLTATLPLAPDGSDDLTGAASRRRNQLRSHVRLEPNRAIVSGTRRGTAASLPPKPR